MAEIKYIPVSKLWRHPDNPRKDLGDVTELAESIKVNGVLQNLTVVPLIGEITVCEYLCWMTSILRRESSAGVHRSFLWSA